jgi:hypothetical protein
MASIFFQSFSISEMASVIVGGCAHEKTRSRAVRVWLDDDLAVAGRNLQRANRLTRQGVIQ